MPTYATTSPPPLGFYITQVWWIDTYTHHPGRYYPYHIHGRNGYRDGERISWTIPRLTDTGGPFAFALRPVGTVPREATP